MADEIRYRRWLDGIPPFRPRSDTPKRPILRAALRIVLEETAERILGAEGRLILLNTLLPAFAPSEQFTATR
jgi:hypothetical protein